MLLTGKSKDVFEMWLLKEGNEVIKNGTVEYDLYYMCKYMIPERMVYAKIIDWFDSVSIHIAIDPHIGGGADVYYAKVISRMSNFIDTWVDVENPNIIGEYYFSSRTQAAKQAILKANQIYNDIHG